MAEDQGGDSIEVKGPGGTSLRARGVDTINALILVAVFVMGAILYMHMEEAKKSNDAVASTNREVAKALKDSNSEFVGALKEVVKTQRLSACILATDPEKREKEYMQPNSFCNRVSQ